MDLKSKEIKTGKMTNEEFVFQNATHGTEKDERITIVKNSPQK